MKLSFWPFVSTKNATKKEEPVSEETQTVTLTELLDTIHADAQKDSNANTPHITVGKVTKSLKREGLGAMLLMPSAILVLPTGAIPGVPIACAAVIALVSIQILIGQEKLWFPKFLRRQSFNRRRFLNFLRRAKPYAEKIDYIAQPRFAFVNSPVVHRVAAALCLLLSIPIAFVGFVPYLPALLAFPMLFIGLGMCVSDGFLILLGIAVAIGITITVPCMMNVCFY